MASTEKQSTISPRGITAHADRLALYAFAQERSQAYWLLSRLFLRAPDAQHLRQLQDDLAQAEEGGPLGELRREVDACLSDPEPAGTEFARRLLASGLPTGAALPVESFVREGKTPGLATRAVAACMREAGFADIAPDAPSKDHIGAELKFMAMLCYDESQSWHAGRLADARQLVANQRDFLIRHLAAWAPEYCEALEERAEHGYIKAVARLTRRCLIAEVATVENLFISLNRPAQSIRFPAMRRAALPH